MKSKLLYIAAGVAMLSGFMTSCDEEFVRPPMIIPEAVVPAGTEFTSLLDLKTEYWQDQTNFCTTIGHDADGKDIYIKGRVVSNDSTGNIFKSVVIEDETTALAISINAYDLYQSYRFGQEVVINATGMVIGRYNGLIQLGAEGTYNNNPTTTFMDKTVMEEHAQQNGLGNPALVSPIVTTIADLDSYKGSKQELIKWQSRYIRIEGVHFEDAGSQFAPSSTTNRYVKDASGKRVNVRCSSYADWARDYIPDGEGAVTGILSYYGSDWQILINDPEKGLEGFTPYVPVPGKEPAGDGTAASPYNVARALEVAAKNGENSDVSVYTAGYVKSGSIDTSYGNATWEISDSENGSGKTITVYRCKDFNDQKFTDANKVKPGDYIVVYAPIVNFKGNTPETSYGYLYSINGVVGSDTPAPNPDPTPGSPAGDGSEANPYNVAAALEVAVKNGENSDVSVYTAGYVKSGSIDTSYGNATWVIADSKDGSGKTITVFRCKDFGDQKFTDANKVKAGDYIVVYAPIVNYKGNTPETSYGYLISINGVKGDDNPTPDPTPDPDPTPGVSPAGNGSEATPYNCAAVIQINPQSTSEASQSGVWVEGYIVGFFENYNPHFTNESAAAANILISDTPNASAASQCVCVQLVASSATRAALNLKDNPGNLGKKVAVFGDVMKYNTLPGIKNTSNYTIK